MKKATALFVMLCLCMAMAGCGQSKSTAVSNVNSTETQSADSGAAGSGDMDEIQNAESRGSKDGMQGGNGGGMSTENDADIQAVIDANAGKFQQYTFEDAGTGISLEYSLYIPANASSSTSYPLLVYIPDSTASGKSAQEIVEQYYGADVWVTDEDQAKHPSYVLVPAFTETVVDDNWNVSEQVDAAVNLIAELQTTYSIDAARIYTTGQSMGCMTSFYLNSVYPNLFAASMYVSGQWDISVLQGIETQKFFYIAAGGDPRASSGQDEVMTMFDADGVAYSYGTWNAQNAVQEQTNAVAQLLGKGLNANIIRFEAGSVFAEGQSGMEHMASFNYGYKLTAVRDWLFEQTK